MSAIEIKQVMKQKFPKKSEDEISDAFRKVNMGMTQDQRDAKDYRQKIIAGMSEILQESLNEAFKIHDKVIITKGPKDCKGKKGRVGEIKKGLSEWDRRFIIDYEDDNGETRSVQLKKGDFKSLKESLNEKKSGKYVCPKCGNKVKTLEGLKGQADTDDKSSKEKFIHPSKMKIQCPKCKELSSLDNWKYIVESNIDKLLDIFEDKKTDKEYKLKKTSLTEISFDLANRARKKAEDENMDLDDLRDKPLGHTEKQRVKFQKYVDNKILQQEKDKSIINLLGMLTAKQKALITIAAEDISDIPGNWDFKKDTFTDKGWKELAKKLNNNKYLKYAEKIFK